METVTIFYFKERTQHRITFVQVLKEYNKKLDLKQAKELMDSMLDGKPIEYAIDENTIHEIVQELKGLKLHFTIN